MIYTLCKQKPPPTTNTFSAFASPQRQALHLSCWCAVRRPAAIHRQPRGSPIPAQRCRRRLLRRLCLCKQRVLQAAKLQHGVLRLQDGPQHLEQAKVLSCHSPGHGHTRLPVVVAREAVLQVTCFPVVGIVRSAHTAQTQ